MCYFKQWRRARTKVLELANWGTSFHTAISVANKPAKGPGDYPGRWQATQTGMIPMKSGLKDQGLLSVKELWVHLHYPATAS